MSEAPGRGKFAAGARPRGREASQGQVSNAAASVMAGEATVSPTRMLVVFVPVAVSVN